MGIKANSNSFAVTVVYNGPVRPEHLRLRLVINMCGNVDLNMHGEMLKIINVPNPLVNSSTCPTKVLPIVVNA